MKLIFKGKLLKLYKASIILPNKHKVKLEIIKHPGAALIVPFLNKDKIIMLRQFRAAVGGFLYELPAGTRSENESFLTCAKREIIEEVGYSAKRATFLGKIYPVPGYSSEVIYIYKATGLVKKECRHEHDECIQSQVMSRLKARSLFKSGKITDAKTISALVFCGWL
jgi:ADP-ribose pyrophosphatase